MPAVLTRIARCKAQHFERENGEHAGHGIEDKTPEEGQTQRQQQSHIWTGGGSASGTRRLAFKACWRDGTRDDIHQQMLGLRWIAQPGIRTPLIGDREGQASCVIGERGR